MSGGPNATPQIHAILFEPVGCLAEFPAEPFLDMAARFTGKKQSSKSGSRAYWHMLNVMESASPGVEALEIEAVERASVYEDVGPALAELRKLGIKLCIASSLSEAALARFVEKTGESFAVVSSREKAGGIKQRPLLHALDRENLQAAQTMFLTDTAEGMKAAEAAGVKAVLMMNDPDESRRLSMRNPFGGIVSLHELPDFIRLLRAQAS